MLCIEKFTEIYKSEPEFSAFCPYRICPIGAHSDHQYGIVSGFAIDKGIEIEYDKTDDGSIVLTSNEFEKQVEFSLNKPIIKTLPIFLSFGVAIFSFITMHSMHTTRPLTINLMLANIKISGIELALILNAL